MSEYVLTCCVIGTIRTNCLRYKLEDFLALVCCGFLPLHRRYIGPPQSRLPPPRLEPGRHQDPALAGRPLAAGVAGTNGESPRCGLRRSIETVSVLSPTASLKNLPPAASTA